MNLMNKELRDEESKKMKILARIREDEDELIKTDKNIDRIKKSTPNRCELNLIEANEDCEKKRSEISTIYLGIGLGGVTTFVLGGLLTMVFLFAPFTLPILFILPILIVLPVASLITCIISCCSLPTAKKNLKEAEMKKDNAQSEYNAFLKTQEQQEQALLAENTAGTDKEVKTDQSIQCAKNTPMIGQNKDITF